MALFESTVGRSSKGDPKALRPLDPEDVEKIARNAVEAAVDFIDSNLSGIRETTDKYYQGLVGLKTIEGRSKVIVTKVRDGIKSVIPSIARIFTQTDTVAEFYSDDEEDEKLCEDASNYCNSVFWKSGGYRAFIEASIDALKARVGVIKITVQKKEIPYHRTYETTEPDELEQLGQGMQMTEQSDTQSVFTGLRSKYVWELCCVPPEEFIVDSEATDIDKAFLIGHRRPETIASLVEMGYDYEDLKDIPTYSRDTTEDAERKRMYVEREDAGVTPNIDPTSRSILFTEAIIRMDADGDGIAELRRLGLAGDHYKLLSDEPVDYPNYAVVRAEFQPHVFHPICLAEDLVQDQDAQTALLRSIIDNTALVNSPRTEVNDSVVNLDDVKNGEIGAIIRVRQMGQINELVTPFAAGQTLPVLQYLDEVSQKRSGITPLSQGLDGDTLQSTTKIAATAAVQGSDARIEMMARNIGESGLKELFLCILRTAITNIKEDQSIKVSSGYQTIHPRWWHDQVSVRINVGLGSGRIDEKKAALTGALQAQQMIVQQYGLENPLCGWENVRNTLKDLLRLSGVHTTNAYFPHTPQQIISQFNQQMQQANQENQKQQQESQNMQNQAMMELVKVEAQKAQLKSQSDMASVQQKAQAEVQQAQTDMQKLEQKHATDISGLKLQIAKLMADSRQKTEDMYLQDDRERDKNDMDFAIDVAKVGVEEQKVKATEKKIEADRNKPKATVQ